MTSKPFDIPKALIWEAYQHVKANGSAAGIYQESIEQRRLDDKAVQGLEPDAVQQLFLRRRSNPSRFRKQQEALADRVAQTVVKLWLEPKLDPLFLW